MTELSIEARAGRVLVRSDARTLGRLQVLCRDFLSVSVDTSTRRSTELEPTVVGCDEPPAGGHWQRLAAPSRFEPERVLYVDTARRRISIVGPEGEWRTLQILRTIRNILRWQTFVTGDLFVHGGMVAIGGAGVAFLGAKRSGKTSSIVSALLLPDASLVSNDDLSIGLQQDQAVGYGWPRSIAMRMDSILALQAYAAGLGDLAVRGAHPTNRHKGAHNEHCSDLEPRQLPLGVWMYPRELTDALGCGLARGAPVAALVFPRFDDSLDGPRLEPVSSSSARELLLANTEETAVQYDPFLADWYQDRGHARRALVVDRLLSTARVFQLRQSMRSLQQGSALLRGVFQHSAPAA
jgi:hypothetical protein